MPFLRTILLSAVLIPGLVLGSTAAAQTTATPQASGGATALGPAAAGAPCRAPARACVRLSTNEAWLVSGGSVVQGPVRISHGKPGWRTPTGTFRVTFKNRFHRSTIFSGAPMPYSVFFNGGIAFHEGDVRYQSHGCVRMPGAAARAFYDGLWPGDVVQVVA